MLCGACAWLYNNNKKAKKPHSVGPQFISQLSAHTRHKTKIKLFLFHLCVRKK